MSSLPPPPGQGQNHQLIDREEELFVGVTPEGDIKVFKLNYLIKFNKN